MNQTAHFMLKAITQLRLARAVATDPVTDAEIEEVIHFLRDMVDDEEAN